MARIVYVKRWRDLPSNPEGYPGARPAECAEADDTASVPKGFETAERMTVEQYRALERASAAAAAPISRNAKDRAARQARRDQRRSSELGRIARMLLLAAGDRLTQAEVDDLRDLSGE